MPYQYNPTGYTRKKGEKWQACVDYPDPDRPGKGKRRTANARTKKEALALLDAMLVEHRQNRQWRPPTDITVANFLQKWIDNVVGPASLEPKTKENKRLMVKHIVQHMGEHLLAQVGPMEVQYLVKQVTEHGYSSRMVRYVYDVLHEALQTAMEWDLIARNPVDRVKPPKVVYRVKHPLISV